MPPRTALVVWLASAAVLAGCTTVTQPTATPTNSPTYLCTPEAGGTPLPCGPIEAEQAEKRDALYADAEAVYRRYWGEIDRLTLEENPPFTPVLEETTDGTFRRLVQEGLDPSSHRERVSGDVKLVRLERLPGLSRDGSTVALLMCADARDARYVTVRDDTPTAGFVYEMRLYLAPRDDRLKLITSESRNVQEC